MNAITARICNLPPPHSAGLLSAKKRVCNRDWRLVRGKQILYTPLVSIIELGMLNQMAKRGDRDTLRRSPLQNKGYISPNGTVELNFEHIIPRAARVRNIWGVLIMY